MMSLIAFRCLIHNFCKTTYMVASLQNFLRIFFQQHLAIFDHDHFFHQVCCFLDNMCGNNEGTSGLGIFLHQFMVKIITHYNIKTCHRFIHKRKIGFACKCYDNRHHGQHTFGHFIDTLFCIQFKFFDQFLRKCLIPVWIIIGCSFQIIFYFHAAHAASIEIDGQLSGKANVI